VISKTSEIGKRKVGRKDTHINPQLEEISDIFAVAVGGFSVVDQTSKCLRTCVKDIDHGCFGSARCLLIIRDKELRPFSVLPMAAISSGWARLLLAGQRNPTGSHDTQLGDRCRTRSCSSFLALGAV
jgi:hypothetical protein